MSRVQTVAQGNYQIVNYQENSFSLRLYAAPDFGCSAPYKPERLERKKNFFLVKYFLADNENLNAATPRQACGEGEVAEMIYHCLRVLRCGDSTPQYLPADGFCVLFVLLKVTLNTLQINCASGTPKREQSSQELSYRQFNLSTSHRLLMFTPELW